MPDAGETSALYAARPSFLIDDREDAALNAALLNLLVEETTDGLYRCEATFGNWGSAEGEVGFLYFDRRTFDFGKQLTVRAGSGQGAGDLFVGRITGMEGQFPAQRPPQIVVLAEDRLQDLRMTRRTRAFENAGVSDVMEEIAAKHGLRTDLDLEGPTYRVLSQVNQSDLAFLRERARAVDAELWIENDTLHAQARSRREHGLLTLTYGQGLHEIAILADLAGQRTSLVVSGWDVSGKEKLEFQADENAIRPELNGHESGGGLLESVFGQRVERIVHFTPQTLEESRTLAEACYRRYARRFLNGRGTAEGDARLKVGTKVDLQGLGPLFNGSYYVTEVRHVFESKLGFRSLFSVERPGLGRN
jgi:hypothetical protein